MSKVGARIIKSLKEAAVGDFAVVHIGDQKWVRERPGKYNKIIKVMRRKRDGKYLWVDDCDDSQISWEDNPFDASDTNDWEEGYWPMPVICHPRKPFVKASQYEEVTFSLVATELGDPDGKKTG
jgi:hypothetical protein